MHPSDNLEHDFSQVPSSLSRFTREILLPDGPCLIEFEGPPGLIAAIAAQSEQTAQEPEPVLVEAADVYERKPLQEYYRLFGPKTVFIPVSLGTKKPKHAGWQKTTFEQTQTCEYRAELREGNIGILFGSASDNLIGVDCDTEEAAAQFELECQPAKLTVQTRGARGRTFFFRTKGQYPEKIVKIKDAAGRIIGEWRGGGGAQTVVGGLHPAACNYQILNGAGVQEIEVTKIPWPTGWTFPWDAAQEQASAGTARPRKSPGGMPNLDKRIEAYMAAVPVSVAHEHGDDQLFRAARILVIGWGLSQAEALPYMQAFNERCEPPWPEHRLFYKLKEADEKGQGVRGHLRDAEPKAERQTNPGVIGEIGVFPAINWGTSSSNSPNTPEQLSQKAEFPADSILADYYDYAITQSEGADSYITGSILPVIGAILARNVWTPWAAYDGRLYPNIYSILVGPPGNLKSTSIYPAESIARALLEKTRFLSHNYSPEAIFDSFFKHADRLLVCSDAGSTIARWANPYDGQRLSHSFLTLFDCEPMSEGFRRNRQEENLDTQERVTGPLSLSILFGSTLSKCQFDGNNERDGLQRRFLYHLALTKTRELDRPQPDKAWLKGLIDQFERLTYLKGAFVWDSAAKIRFDLYKKEIEQRKKNHDLYDEATQGRLSTLLVYALKIAMIFEAS